MNKLKNLNFDFLFRKKKFTDDIEGTNLSRVMGLIDVTAIGISATLGSGIYVLSGTIIASYSGPAILLSFIIAGIGTFFSAMSYAELGARVPKSGSAYVYIYVTIGEFVGFIMGWDLILEYMIGVASISNALSKYIDFLTGGALGKAFRESIPMNVTGLGPYPDFFAFGLAFLITGLMIIGVKESSLLNKIFTLLNITVLTFIIIAGATKANFQNWNLNVNNVSWYDAETNATMNCTMTKRCGNGGYTPFGFGQVINGAAKCFYAYIGFDAIATTGEEVINPKRNLPLSIVLTLIVASVLYCCLSGVLTLMIPYYIINADTPLPSAFQYVNMHWATYVVSIGAVISLSTCLYGAMFPMPRIVYSMSSDGLIFKFLSKLMPKFKTPYVASICTGLISGILACMFDLKELVEMLSIGTLMAYTLVSLCVLILRYKPETEKVELERRQNLANADKLKLKLLGDSDEKLFKRLFNPSLKEANQANFSLVVTLIAIATIGVIGLSAVVTHGKLSNPFVIMLIIILVAFVLTMAFMIYRQPQVTNITTFKIPLVPFLPLLSVLINIYMMMTLTAGTWLRFVIWFVLGIIVYLMYGASHSKENKSGARPIFCCPCIVRTNAVANSEVNVEYEMKKVEFE